MLVSAIIRSVSLDLNDQEPGHEYVRWTVEQLQNYLQEALVELASVAPHYFTKQKVVRLQHGTRWHQACDCTHVIRVLGESDRDGNIIQPLVRRNDDDANTWTTNLKKCTSPTAQLQSYSISKTDDSYYKVYPPVLPGVERWVVLECYTEPDGDLNDDVPQRFLAAIRQWMLYRAYDMDAENNQLVQTIAAKHKETYLMLYQSIAREEALLEVQQNGNSVRPAQNSSSGRVSQ